MRRRASLGRGVRPDADARRAPASWRTGVSLDWLKACVRRVRSGRRTLSASMTQQIYHTAAGNCLPRRKFMAYDRVFPEVPAMTMLDRMRRHRNWLKWSLGLVVPGVRHLLHSRLPAADPTPAPPPRDTVAVVEGHEITRGRIPADVPGAAAGVPERVRRQHERAAAEAARRRPADPAADGRRAGGARRGRAARHHA